MKRRAAPCHACRCAWSHHAAGFGACRSCPCERYTKRPRAARPRPRPPRPKLTIEDFLREVERLGLGAPLALRELGLGAGATDDDVRRAFRRRALKAHPDHGGDPEVFKALVRARDAALTAIGARA